MATKEITNVKIVASRANSIATALRGHISAALSYYRVGEYGLMNEALTEMQRDAAMLELEMQQGRRA